MTRVMNGPSLPDTMSVGSSNTTILVTADVTSTLSIGTGTIAISEVKLIGSSDDIIQLDES